MEEKQNKIGKNSTVAISAIDAKKLDRFCKSNGLSKKEFITVSLNYFIKEGINPKTHESPHAELSKLNKRIDQLFGFIKKQEQDLLKPIAHEIVKGSTFLNESFLNVVKNQEILQNIIRSESKSVLSETKNNYMKSNDTQEHNRLAILNSQNDIKIALQILAQYMDDKNKKGLLGKLFD